MKKVNKGILLTAGKRITLDFGKMNVHFHEECFILAEKTQSAGIANSLTGDTLLASRQRTNRKQRMENQSGNIRIENQEIFWDFQNENIVRLSIDNIIAVGEYTCESLGDDWFLVFVKKDKSWVKISMYAEQINLLLEFLSEKIDGELKNTQLANSTKWNSIVSFPNTMRGKYLFDKKNKTIELNEEINHLLTASQ